MEKLEVKLAKLVNELGGKTYYVGGYVRDQLRNTENKDVDIEVHGIKPDELLDILNKLGEPLSYGKSFGIYSLAGSNIDIALPRIEHKTGSGHKDFEVYVDPYIDLTAAIKRRDFTINAIYKDVLTGELIDPFNGIKDIKDKIIRHIDETSFIEDPLRVLRGCQFASRFEYTIAKQTIELCKSIDINTLSNSRVNEELKKALLQSKNPSLFFKYLKDMNKLDDWFIDVNIDYIDQANKYINNIKNKYAYLLSSLSINCDFDISKFINEKQILNYVSNMIDYINVEVNDDLSLYKVFDKLIDINDYLYLRLVIKNEDLFDKYNKYQTIMSKPNVMGKDLIELGYTPSDSFNEILNYALELRLLGYDKQEVISKIKDAYRLASK